jgi:2-polyprenyl-3-methyl-5-hydroxy-6-metoxy-1,4-benzoquinol methylase
MYYKGASTFYTFVIMDALNQIKNIDIYLLDQLLKGRLVSTDTVLDAGCGSGRNIKYLIQEDYSLYGIDDDKMVIDQLKMDYPDLAKHFINTSIESYVTEKSFDFIICNAVLHFSNSHKHFDELFKKLISLLSENGTLFIRMTTDIGIKDLLTEDVNGVYFLPDNSYRYLISNKKILELIDLYLLELIEPIKTVVVDGKRSMATLVFQRK